MVTLQVRLVHAEKLTRRQRRRFRWTQNWICSAWEDYRLTTMTLRESKRLLDRCAHLAGPTE